jgi:hypothetical protein
VFTVSTIVLGNWGGRQVPTPLRNGDIVRAESAASLVDTIGRLAAQCAAANPPSRLEAV